jgi:type I restriction enzyme S subunit
MELKAGYKQTEVGVIPEGWEVKRLGEIGKVVRGGSPRPAGDPKFFDGDFIPWLTVAALTNIPDHQLEVRHTESRLTQEGAKRSRTLQPGTVIIANSGATLGVAKVSSIECCANDGVAAIIDQHIGNKAFICYCINAQTQRLRDVVATGNGQPNLNTGLIKEIAIPWPPQDEQAAIAECFSDLDKLLHSLENAAVKKHRLKQAAMQELLTGKRRLPGFEGEWEVKRLGEIGSTFGGLTGKTKLDFGNGVSRYVTFMNVMMNIEVDCECFERVRIAPNESQNRVLRGDLLFNGSSETPEEVAMCSLLTKDVSDLYLNSFCFGFRLLADARVSGLFLTYLIRSHAGREVIKCLAQGSTRYNLSKSALLDAAIQLPALAEQNAIASVLSDMDAELTALEARKAKAQMVKQGMMQQLLTGKIRVK